MVEKARPPVIDRRYSRRNHTNATAPGSRLARALILALACALAGAAAAAKEKPSVQYQIPLPAPPDFSALDWLLGEWTGEPVPR